MSIIDPKIKAYRNRIREILQEMISGKLSYIEGCREILPLRRNAFIDDSDEDFLILVGIVSETDEFPLGIVRNMWDKNALSKIEPEFEEAERWAKKVGASSCQKIAARYQ